MSSSKRRAARPSNEATLEISIAELSAGGDGVAICEIEGERRAIFVSGVAPGDRVRAQVDLSTRPARGRVLTVVEPGAARVATPCPHAGTCGGCDWMHLSLDGQARAHVRIVEQVLPRAFAATPVVAHAAPRTVAYRTRARVHVEAKGGRLLVGMYAPRSHAPVPVDACMVLEAPIERARTALASWLEGARGKGEVQLALGAVAEPRGSVDASARLTVADIRWSGDLPPAVFGRLEQAVARGELAGVRLFQGAVRVPATIGDPTPWITGADGAPLRLAPGGFSQASEEGNAVLARRAVDLALSLAPAPKDPTVELYAGSGNLTVLLAASRSVTAVEANAEACEAARANLEARRLTARVVAADAGTFAIPPATRLVVIDPPRTGAKDVVRTLASRRGLAVVYVSCDPPTLGRDLAVLADAGYELRAIETFEMFPQTSHVETVAALVRTRSRAGERGA